VEHWTRARVPEAHTGIVFVTEKIASVGSLNISNSPVCVHISVFLYFKLCELTALDTLQVIKNERPSTNSVKREVRERV